VYGNNLETIKKLYEHNMETVGIIWKPYGKDGKDVETSNY
jgi:hypothetical protein